MPLSPGMKFIASGTSRVVIPIVIVLGVTYFLNYAGRDDLVPKWLNSYPRLVLCSLGLGVALHLGKHARHALQEEREMRSLGAIRVPAVRGKLPGSVDLFQMMIESFRTDYVAQFLEDASIHHGYLFRLEILADEVLVTFNPSDVKQILTTDFPVWDKGQKLQDAMQSFLGTGVFNSDGNMWKFHRNMTRPFFTRERVVDFEIFRHRSDHAVCLIKERCRNGEPIDMQDLAGRFTMDAATQFLFGLDVKTLSFPLYRPKTGASTSGGENLFVKSFSNALTTTTFRLFAGSVWPLWEITGDCVAKDAKEVHAFLDPIVDEALRQKKEKQGHDQVGSDDHETLLDHLVASTDDRTIIRDELINILMAGRDTTAHAITAVFYLLASQDPQILSKLREEILQQVGASRSPDYDDIRSMKYLRAVINETLRLFPSVPANLRQSNKSTVWTSDDGTRYYIPKGTVVVWSTIGMHRRKDLWGPDALEFDPGRWLDERNKKYFLANPMIYLPFHGGPRICLGQQFALNETSFFIVRLLQAFDDVAFSPGGFPPDTLAPPEWKDGNSRKPMEKVQPRAHLTMYFEGGMWLRFRESASAN